MLAATLKSVISLLMECSGNSRILLNTVAIDTGYGYNFDICRNELRYTILSGGSEISQYCSDPEMLKLPKHLKPTMWEHTEYATDGSPYDMNHMDLRYEANLFIKLFRLMSERGSFTMRLHGTVIQAYYFEGKVYYVSDGDDKLVVNVTTLYSLFKIDNNYRVLAVNSVPANIESKSWLKKQEDRALKLGIEFHTHRPSREVAQYAKV